MKDVKTNCSLNVESSAAQAFPAHASGASERIGAAPITEARVPRGHLPLRGLRGFDAPCEMTRRFEEHSTRLSLTFVEFQSISLKSVESSLA